MQDRKASEKQIGCLPGDLFPKWGNGLAEFLRLLSYLTLVEFHNYVFIRYRQIFRICR